MRVTIPIYTVAQLGSGVVSFFQSTRGAGTFGYACQAVVFYAFAVFLIFQGSRVAFQGRSVRVPRRSFGYLVFPALVFLFGPVNYLGLSTSGNFSMFSNIRTEGHEWNHVWIPRSVRVFHYQDRIYWIHDIDPAIVRPNREHPRRGFGMPEIEMYRVIDAWRARRTMPAFIDYEVDGVRQNLSDFRNLMSSARPYRWIEQKLLFFRRVQPPGPNFCRW